MKTTMKTYGILVAALILCLSPMPVQAGLLYDHFDDGVLDPAWNIFLSNASGWSFVEAGTDLTVFDINSLDVSMWSRVSLMQTINPLNDFAFNFDFSWNENDVTARQAVNLRLSVYGMANIVRVGFRDGSLVASGAQFAQIGNSSPFSSGFGSLGLSGSANVEILRQNGNVDILWNGVNLLSGFINDPVTRVFVDFYSVPIPGVTTASDGNAVSADLVAQQPMSIPEPSTMTFLSAGLVGLFLAGRKIIKK